MSTSSPPSSPASTSSTSRRAPPRSRASTVVLLVLTALVAAVFFGAIGLAAWLVVRSEGTVAEGSFLDVKLAGEIPDAPVVGGMFLDPADAPPILTDIAGAVRKAAADPRIEGLYLTLDAPSAGWAGAQELRAAIADFRAAGKPCVAYAEAYTTASYYLATACDKVVVAPAGVGLVTGIAASVTYYAGTFEKLGIQAQMLHVGDFKSAVEPYERTGPSDPASEAMNALLDSLWSQYVADVAASRGKTPEEVQAWIDVPALYPTGMLERGMVDAVAYPDRARALAKEAKADDWAARVSSTEVTEPDPDAPDVEDGFTSLKEYLKAERHRVVGGDRIAVIYAEGPILSGEADGGMFGSQMIADRTFRDWLDDVREDDTVKAVVLRVNSPGGSALAADMMWRELVRLDDVGKPLVVSMGNYAASGGYYIAAPADWIVADPGTLTGSIGVFGGKMSFAGTYEKVGLTEYTYPRGAMADLLSSSHPFTDEQRAVFQAFLDNGYETFLSRVSAGRKLDRDTVHAVAQGRVWTGTQALDHKLVDELGGLDVAVKKAAELASVEDYDVARWPAQKSLMEVLLEDLDQSRAGAIGGDALARLAEGVGVPRRALTDVATLARVLDDGGVAALLPGALVITP